MGVKLILTTQVKAIAISLARDIFQITWVLFRIIVPVLVCIRLLETLGVIDWLAQVLSPLMTLVGLPGEAALAWLTTVATGIYGGLAVFFSASYIGELSVAQVSVLGSLMLLTHGLPVEGSIAKRVGLTWLMTILLRVVGGFTYAALLHLIYQWGNFLSTPHQVIIPLMSPPTTWGQWVVSTAVSLWWIFVVIALLVVFLRLLRYWHIERLMGYLLSPILKLLGISQRATNITIIGITLGLAYGGGLLIREADAGKLDKQDVFSAMCLLSLSHGLIEDTLLILTMGADLNAILWGRLLFTVVIIAILARWARRRSRRFTQTFLFK